MIKILFEIEKKRAVAYDIHIEIGECDFIENNGTWNIIHTGVNSKYQGQGIARKLVECVIKNAKEYNKKIIAECSYARKILDK